MLLGVASRHQDSICHMRQQSASEFQPELHSRTRFAVELCPTHAGLFNVKRLNFSSFCYRWSLIHGPAGCPAFVVVHGAVEVPGRCECSNAFVPVQQHQQKINNLQHRVKSEMTPSLLAVHCVINKWFVTGLSVALHSSFIVAVFLPITRTS